MGNRAVIHFYSRDEVGPAVYLHWCGGSEGVRDLLGKTYTLMESRGPDVSYVTARCIGLAHEEDPRRDVSLGTWSVKDLAQVRTDDYSHGDAGVFLVNLDNWTVECWGGYGLDEGSGERPRPTAASPKIVKVKKVALR